MRYIRSRHKTKKKPKPANELSEQEISQFMQALANFDGYPRLRELPKLLTGMAPAKINTIIRFLERSGAIVIDIDGHIVWSRIGKQEELTLGQVANMTEEARNFFDRNQ